MSEWITLEQIDEARIFVESKIRVKPRIALVLGSGLGGLADLVENPDIIGYKDIPHWPQSTIQGHVGRLVVGVLEGQPVLVMQGRSHFYEGYDMGRVTFPIRVMQRMGIESIILTNAAGGINPEYQPGDVMLISDHINLIGMAGLNPLRGPNLDVFGERFPDMSQVYDPEYLQQVREIARNKQVDIQEGVYAGLSGPSFETPADLRFLRVIGADAVGMSTVAEATVARHGKTRVLGFSGISNKANLDGSTITTHEEVLEAGKILVPKLTVLIREMLRVM